MVAAIIWPEKLLKPQKVNIDIAHRNLRSPSAASGFTQTVTNSAGLWKITFGSIPVYTNNMIKAWRAIDALAEGQLNPISLPAYDFGRTPGSTDLYGRNVQSIVCGGVPFSDTSTFSDTSLFVSSYTNIMVATPATAGSTTVSMVKSKPYVAVEPGQMFSIDDRLYRIKRVQSQTDTTASVTITPPLREAIVESARCEFDKPRVRVKLLSDTAMSLPLDFNQQSFPDLDFIEDL